MKMITQITKAGSICILLLAITVLTGCTGDNYRFAVNVNTADYQRQDKPIEIDLNITEMLSKLSRSQALDTNSISVVEVDNAGQIIDQAIPFQFDKGADFDAVKNAKGKLTFILKGQTSANTTRHFYIHFGKEKTLSDTQPIEPLVSVTDVNDHEGQESFKIDTQNATYYYHKFGAGFASLQDKDGADWIGYHPTGGASGHYRGIPNTGYPDDYCHPGKTVSNSAIISDGPVKVSIYSQSNDKKWIGIWDIFSHYARWTVIEAITPYWFLYEGTPGGKLDEDTDFCVRQNGNRTTAGQKWVADIKADGQRGEWLYIGDGDRVLYLIHHIDDDAVDLYRPMRNAMTVFGFGRKRINKFMHRLPDQFTIGLYDSSDFDIISAAINSAYQPLDITLGDIESVK